MHRQTEQIDVCDLLVSHDEAWAEQSFIEQGDLLLPKFMAGMGTKNAQTGNHFRRAGLNRGIGRVAQDANAAIDGQWTCSPAAIALDPEPTMGVLMVGVRGIKQRYENVHVQQGDAHASSRS